MLLRFTINYNHMTQMRIHTLLLVTGLLLVTTGAYPFEHFLRVSGDFSYARDHARSGAVWDNSVPVTLQDAEAFIGSGVMEQATAGNGFSPALGVGYRMKFNHFLLDVGVGAEYRQSWLGLHDVTNAYAAGVDEEGFGYMGHHQWTNRRGVLRHAGLTLPITVGGEWDEWFFLAGVKGAIDIWGTCTERGAYSLEGAYDRYMDAFEGMANHGFVTDEPYRCEPVAQPSGISLRACAEVGYCVYGASSGRYRLRETVKVYVSAFGEYGVLTNKNSYTPFLLGVRATLLVPLPTKKECTCWKF